MHQAGGLCGGPSQGPGYQPPTDNKCKSFGGCAVPISAYQLYPEDGSMALYSFAKDPQKPGGFISNQIFYGTNPAMVQFHKGDVVHEVAYKAYTIAMRVAEPRRTGAAEPAAQQSTAAGIPPSTRADATRETLLVAVASVCQTSATVSGFATSISAI